LFSGNLYQANITKVGKLILCLNIDPNHLLFAKNILANLSKFIRVININESVWLIRNKICRKIKVYFRFFAHFKLFLLSISDFFDVFTNLNKIKRVRFWSKELVFYLLKFILYLFAFVCALLLIKVVIH